MTDEDNIPGTRVPDTPIHRASLWLEELKFPGRREDAGVEAFEPELFQRFAAEVHARFTPEQMEEAATYYGDNNVRMLTGGHLDVMIPSPLGGHLRLRDIFISLWLDAFMHGAATMAGKRGLSNEEIAEGKGTPTP